MKLRSRVKVSSPGISSRDFETVIDYSLRFELPLVSFNACFLVVRFHSGVIGQLSLLLAVTSIFHSDLLAGQLPL